MGNNQALELTEKMIERHDMLDNLAYGICLDYLGISREEAEKKFPWNLEVIRGVVDAVISNLWNHGYPVCNPYISESDNDRYCILLECGCKKCHCQEEQMDKEYLFDSIDEAVCNAGYKILDGDNNSIIVKNRKTEREFQIKIESYIP